MSIYQQIASNRFRTFLIMSGFVFLLTALFYGIGLYYGNSQFFFVIGLGIAVLSSFFSYFFSDKIVLSTTGARPAKKEEFFDYYTVTENLSLAAGLPMPRLYVIDDPAPNAFATGRDPKHAVVCATTGLLEKLDRSEIEGVVAHELSHVKNYDILLMSIVSVLVGTVAIVTDMIMRSLFWGGGDNRGGNKNPLFLILFLVVMVLTPIIATIIQLAISRRREFLADASAALITRYPEGLARALEKISADRQPMRRASSATAHMFISSPLEQRKKKKNMFTNLFSTHPPAEERIRILRSM